MSEKPGFAPKPPLGSVELLGFGAPAVAAPWRAWPGRVRCCEDGLRFDGLRDRFGLAGDGEGLRRGGAGVEAELEVVFGAVVVGLGAVVVVVVVVVVVLVGGLFWVPLCTGIVVVVVTVCTPLAVTVT
ncbi:MAG: hypothetical protein JOZ07_04240 [Solirubrobacterales bacterium]|nr:hypothetical protein [Solirubrobacterales bacterium]